MDALDRIHQLVITHRIILFMKGTLQNPMSTESAIASKLILKYTNEVRVINIQEDPEIRAFLPLYQDWIYFPQLYINGDLIGGAEVLEDLEKQNELGPLLRHNSCQRKTA
ncbi:MAG: glutaredoxin domain-containing protein [bacterium]